MTSASKASQATNLDLSGLVEGTEANALDVSTPFTETEIEIDKARQTLSVSDTDTHVKNLNDAIVVSSPIAKTLQSPAGDEKIALSIDTYAAPFVARSLAAYYQVTGAPDDDWNILTNDISSTTPHIRLILRLRSNRTATTDDVRIRFNTDQNAVYNHMTYNQNAGVGSGTEGNNQGQIIFSSCVPAAQAAINRYAFLDIMIYNAARAGGATDFPTVEMRGVMSLGDSAGNNYVLNGFAIYKSASPAEISSIQIDSPNTGAWEVGSSYVAHLVF